MNYTFTSDVLIYRASERERNNEGDDRGTKTAAGKTLQLTAAESEQVQMKKVKIIVNCIPQV